jgi:hypothetical protein
MTSPQNILSQGDDDVIIEEYSDAEIRLQELETAEKMFKESLASMQSVELDQ